MLEGDEWQDATGNAEIAERMKAGVLATRFGRNSSSMCRGSSGAIEKGSLV